MKKCTSQEFEGDGSTWLATLIGVYTTIKIFPMGNFIYGWKKWHGCQHINIFCKSSSTEVKFLGQLKPSDKKLDMPINSYLRHYFMFISILSIIPAFVSNNLVLGWNSWPTIVGASSLYLNRPLLVLMYNEEDETRGCSRSPPTRLEAEVEKKHINRMQHSLNPNPKEDITKRHGQERAKRYKRRTWGI